MVFVPKDEYDNAFNGRLFGIAEKTFMLHCRAPPAVVDVADPTELEPVSFGNTCDTQVPLLQLYILKSLALMLKLTMGNTGCCDAVHAP